MPETTDYCVFFATLGKKNSRKMLLTIVFDMNVGEFFIFVFFVLFMLSLIKLATFEKIVFVVLM